MLGSGNDSDSAHAREVARLRADASAEFVDASTVDELKSRYWDGSPERWWKVRDLQDYCIESRDNGLANSLVITGPWGSGKSQLSQLLAGPPLDRGYTLRRNVLLNPDPIQIVRHIDGMGKKIGPILDEAVMALFALKFQDAAQQTLQQYITANLRKELEGTLFCNIPSTYDFQTSFMRSCVDFWIKIIAPGIAVIFMRDRNECPDPFYKDILAKEWISKARADKIPVELRNTDLDWQLSVITEHLTFFRILTFDPMDSTEYEKYIQYYHENWLRHKEAFLQYSYEKDEYKRARAEKFKMEMQEKAKQSRLVSEKAALLNEVHVYRCGCQMQGGKYLARCELHTPRVKKVVALPDGTWSCGCRVENGIKVFGCPAHISTRRVA